MGAEQSPLDPQRRAMVIPTWRSRVIIAAFKYTQGVELTL